MILGPRRSSSEDVPNVLPALITSPLNRDREGKARTEQGDPWTGMSALARREKYLGPLGGPQGSNRGELGASPVYDGPCSPHYLDWLGKKPKVDLFRGRPGFREIEKENSRTGAEKKGCGGNHFPYMVLIPNVLSHLNY